MKNWETRRLGDVVDHRLGKMLDAQKNKGEYLPYLGNLNVRWGAFDLENLGEMRFELHELDRYRLKDGDIVMCEGGEPGRCAIWKDDRPGMMIQKALHRIRPHSCLDNRFLYYTFLHMGRTGGFASLFTGATIQHLPGQNLAKVEIKIPPLPAQRRIAGILSAYDDLIENNRRRIQLLEQAARLIYQEWFVRLRFPGHEHVRVVDGVPEGWERSQLCALCDEIRETVKGRQLDPASPYIGLEHMPRRSITLSDWGVASEVQSDKHVFHTGDILFGKIRPYFHKVGVCLTEGVASTDAIVIRPRTADYYGIVLMTVSSDLFVAHATQSSHGSKMPRANWKVLERFPVLVPPGSLLADFSGLIDPIVAQLRTLALTNRRLRQARDLLLPKLMSGEIEV